jgi:molybdopterin-guanine dinucleotide biosynthesis protein A
MNCAAAILAGGKATRMGGTNKAFLVVDGRRIVDRQLDVLRQLFDEILLSANDPAPYADLGLRVVPDPIPDAGPLGGILGAIEAAACDRVVVVGCDMPWIDAAALRLVIAPDDDADLVIPVANGRPEPLHARYGRRLAPLIVRRIAAGRLAPHDLVEDPAVRVTRIEEPALRTIDPALRFLCNCNTPTDLAAARRT